MPFLLSFPAFVQFVVGFLQICSTSKFDQVHLLKKQLLVIVIAATFLVYEVSLLDNIVVFPPKAVNSLK